MWGRACAASAVGGAVRAARLRALTGGGLLCPLLVCLLCSVHFASCCAAEKKPTKKPPVVGGFRVPCLRWLAQSGSPLRPNHHNLVANNKHKVKYYDDNKGQEIDIGRSHQI